MTTRVTSSTASGSMISGNLDMDGVTVALNARGMTVAAALQCAWEKMFTRLY